jgi:D-alanyl-lipoteichoic acid acyltransferase DltB (MBOAT superfamily)
MLFTTIEFWIFFIPVLFLYHALEHRKQNTLLLVAGYIFYASWNWRFLFLILTSTSTAYFLAAFVAPGRNEKFRTPALVVSTAINLGILGFFKYCDFFIASITSLLGVDAQLSESLLLHLILPVGISFYTFQTLSYVFDVHAGKILPVKSFMDFALFVSFFPQLLAGPIERGSRLIPQIVEKRRFDASLIEPACHLIVVGLFKKAVIADALTHPVNAVFAAEHATGPEIYTATFLFAFQLYCDFSGYSDISRGVARLLGIDLMLNFNLPYFAANPTEFWQRWHISLSTWLRDYLYIPLGGNRNGQLKTHRNLFITMLLGGLWHGARLNFILWGAYHGLLLCIHKLVGRRKPDRKERGITVWAKRAVTFQLVLFGWLLFRVENMAELKKMLLGLTFNWTSFESTYRMMLYAAPLLIPLFALELWQWRTKNLEPVNRLPRYLRALFFCFLLSTVLLLNRGGGVPFVYFQF